MLYRIGNIITLGTKSQIDRVSIPIKKYSDLKLQGRHCHSRREVQWFPIVNCCMSFVIIIFQLTINSIHISH
ncbi:hypothetical protein Bhyg_14377 [Pseudolycoriella hygida]|uniref:Uncharacterized protein n=1 Tax=Pseudolycoriella hygida TaxID=35572 RepID=A0A9Q0MQ21_9DIPT|nr:hypothetical protein Bhyg_14377 [Pseudolycoriella hygida]